jgi:N6-adenosine-specific RNA methylase IME4
VPQATHLFDELPRRRFACILADPPWRFKVWSRKTGLGRSADQHYPTLTLQDIEAFPVADVAAKDAFLFLWVTGPFLTLGAHVSVIRAWGFEPSGIMFTWIKLNRISGGYFVGMGYNTRHNAEVCLVARRGSPKRLRADIRELIAAPVSEHSRKPIEAHERIEKFCAGPRLELFARRRPSTSKSQEWTVFGNQIDKIGRRGLA